MGKLFGYGDAPNNPLQFTDLFTFVFVEYAQGTPGRIVSNIPTSQKTNFAPVTKNDRLMLLR
jgi:hypothetical protein